MMKKLLIIVFAVFIAIPSYSQMFKFGIKAGAQSTTVPTYDFTTGTSNITALENAQWGFHGGLFARIKLGPIYLQPEVVFTTSTFEYNVDEGASLDVLKKQTFNRLSIPLLVGFKLGPVRINAGPAAAIQIGSPEALLESENFEDMYKSALWGYQAGLGIDLFKKLTFDVRYAGGLGDLLGDSVTIGTQTFNLDYSQTSFMLSVGWMF
jgi:hypothetical protein